jgi:hypothetical protein
VHNVWGGEGVGVGWGGGHEEGAGEGCVFRGVEVGVCVAEWAQMLQGSHLRS